MNGSSDTLNPISTGFETVLPRSEHPNPQFQRDCFFSLNGIWKFDFDDKDCGLSEEWYYNHELPNEIVVPFAYQSELSGIKDLDFHDVVWYQRTFSVPSGWEEKRILLHFGAVDYQADVWLNGRYVGQHAGGHTPFTFDITEFVVSHDNNLVLRAQDFSLDLSLPRGKQYWEKDSASIFYTRTTGIWQSVWVEAVPRTYIADVKHLPDLDQAALDLTVHIEGYRDDPTTKLEFETIVTFMGKVVSTMRSDVLHDRFKLRVYVNKDSNEPTHVWAPEHPNLYDITYRLLVDGKVLDTVSGYFGLRKVCIENGVLFLNNRPYFLRMVLDQGYFPDGNLTPPSDEAIRKDVELIKSLGFNGARKHQKIEDPRYLYWCDKLGLVVWGEMANSYEYSELSIRRLTAEWQEAIIRDFNHPCIIAWVPLNESWGVPNMLSDARQRAF
ncbi:hypothetical protein GCM10025858_29990 [Alicyclobacillus sacchari]|nr:hypothetical protein GCM10025858_29990 [Alicyclobacillus sacchari]